MASGEASSLGLIPNLWNDVRRAVHLRSPCNLTDLEHFSNEDLNKIAKSGCANLEDSYHKTLSAVLQANCALTKYYFRDMNTYIGRLL